MKILFGILMNPFPLMAKILCSTILGNISVQLSLTSFLLFSPNKILYINTILYYTNTTEDQAL